MTKLSKTKQIIEFRQEKYSLFLSFFCGHFAKINWTKTKGFDAPELLSVEYIVENKK